ncbi:MAG TPA: hypothetical protein VFI39_03800 [Gemmatimonadales bacterium]|nr:hypothetical protein [Gemmatimonadales bacterium]
MRKSLLTLLLAGAALPAGLAAQSTGTPVFAAPYRAFQTSEVGASLSDPVGGGVALEGFYRIGSHAWDIGFRGGFDAPNGNANTTLLLGVDGRTRVLTHDEGFPLDGALTLGFGGRFVSGGSAVLVPIGLSLGRRLDLEGSSVSFVPYVQPVLTPVFGSGNNHLDFTIGLGVDMRMSRRVDLRVAGGIGDLDGVSVSAAFLR